MSHFISRLFGSSPVKPIQRHFEKAAQCAGLLVPFFEAVIADQWDAAAAVRADISDLENVADELKRELRLNLPTSLFMPVARSDLLELITMQDKIANKAKDISGLVLGRRMKIPRELVQPYTEFLKRSLAAVKQARKSVNELDELFETGFKGAEVDLVIGMIEKLDRLEHEGDKMQVELRSRLFEFERDLPPIDAMFLYKLADWTGDLGDLAQRVGSRLQIMMAR